MQLSIWVARSCKGSRLSEAIRKQSAHDVVRDRVERLDAALEVLAFALSVAHEVKAQHPEPNKRCAVQLTPMHRESEHTVLVNAGGGVRQLGRSQDPVLLAVDLDDA